MAFSQSALQAELYSVFNSMTDGDNHKFSKGISGAFKNFVNSGKPQTTDSGSIPTGAFTGASVSGSMTSDSSSCEGIIQSACEAMVNGSKNNDYIAEKIAEGLQDLTDGTEVNTSVSGTTVPPVPPPPTIPTSGSAKGGINCDTSPVEAGLKACFSSMADMTEGGNMYFASELARLTYSCLTSGTVNTEGVGNLEGSKGVGKAS